MTPTRPLPEQIPASLWKRACSNVVEASYSAKPGALIHYAAAYAKTGRDMQGEERRVQALYILNNLSAWRGADAKAVKAVFKAVADYKPSYC